MKTDKPPRAWHNEKMDTVAAFCWKDNSVLLEDEDNWISLRSEGLVIMWPTGLLDKNGTEAYGSEEHGDIIRYFDWIGVIRWSEYNLAWSVDWIGEEPPSGLGGNRLGGLSRNDVEIIGNSLQHPDLLKKE